MLGITWKSKYERFPLSSRASSVNRGNKDGMDEAAEAVIRANPKFKIKELEEQLKALGIKRGTTWISKARARIMGTGVTCGEVAAG